MPKIFLGVGHGGSDPGAVAGVKEKDLNLAIALACRDELVRHGVDVKMSRTTDENDPLEEEIREANAFLGTSGYAIDIHNNAGGGDGVEIFHSAKSAADDALARNVLDAIIAIGQNSRGIKTKLMSNGNDWFGFIRQIKAPSILVECAFVDTKDVQIVDTTEEQKTMGIAIAKGILKTLGISYVEAGKTTENAATVNAGDLVALAKNAVYYNGWIIPAWVKAHYWYVDSVKGDRAVLGKNQSGFNNINSPVNTKFLTVMQSAKVEVSHIPVAKPTETPKTDDSALKVGDKVKMSAAAVQYGKKAKFASFVYSSTLYVREINGNRIVVSTQKTGAVTGAVHSKYLTKI